ncbi:FAD-binding protein [Saccharopolyspora hattusasensis]|uniref:FAD-binding protein n=1 Tax=Saccharopolyspora hattusasensis TaxID=1128679 RepID=UPI003D9844FF
MVGFSSALGWITAGMAGANPSWEAIPELDGVLTVEPAALDRASRDWGNIVRRRPSAVLWPGSARDVAAMIRYCRARHIKVAAHGSGHWMFGQSLVADGLLIDMRSLNTIHSLHTGRGGADVDAGVIWRDLVKAADAKGLRATSGLTGHLGPTIGGTLQTGGISPNYRHGAQVDHVRWLEVVTGAGEIVTCSATHNAELFDAVLAGLGQCGIVTRVKLDLMPRPRRVRSWIIPYLDHPSFFADLRTLARRGEVDEVFGMWQPGSTGLVPTLNIAVYSEPESPPDSGHLLRGLHGVLPVPLNWSYLAHALFFDGVMRVTEALGWEHTTKPWFDAFLPDSTVEPFVTNAVKALSVRDWSPTGYVLLFVHHRDTMRRPNLRLPSHTDGDLVYLFDLLNDSTLAVADRDFAADMLARNKRLYEQARSVGGTLYPIGATPMTRADWARHYGDRWPIAQRRKAQFDPDTILGPGPGIFDAT